MTKAIAVLAKNPKLAKEFASKTAGLKGPKKKPATPRY